MKRVEKVIILLKIEDIDQNIMIYLSIFSIELMLFLL